MPNYYLKRTQSSRSGRSFRQCRGRRGSSKPWLTPRDWQLTDANWRIAVQAVDIAGLLPLWENSERSVCSCAISTSVRRVLPFVGAAMMDLSKLAAVIHITVK